MIRDGLDARFVICVRNGMAKSIAMNRNVTRLSVLFLDYPICSKLEVAY